MTLVVPHNIELNAEALISGTFPQVVPVGFSGMWGGAES